MSFGKVAEFQRRGVVHYHAILRLDGIDHEDQAAAVAPPAWASVFVLAHALRDAFAGTWFRTPHPERPDGWVVAWGDPDAGGLDVRPLRFPGDRLIDRTAVAATSPSTPLPSAPPPGVPAVPHAHRRRGPGRVGPAPDSGQLRHPRPPRSRSGSPATPASTCTSPPTSSSWLNLVERWFAELTNRKLRRSAHRSVLELEADVRNWINKWNKNPKPFIWTKTADRILETLAAYCQRINDSAH